MPKFQTNRPEIRRERAFQRILLPTCLPAGRYSDSMFLRDQEEKPRSAARMSKNALSRLILNITYAYCELQNLNLIPYGKSPQFWGLNTFILDHNLM